ncbi:MAG: ABC transporter permease [Candidatus Eremiobacterota bacterium]
MFRDNAIWYREWTLFRRRLRGPRLAQLFYPGMVLTPALLLSLLHPQGAEQDTAFAIAAFLHATWCMFRAISATVGTVAWEEERRTWDALLATPISAAGLFWGKVLSSLSPLALTLVGWSPVWAWYLLDGGATPGQLVKLAVLTAALVALFGALGTWASVRQPTADRAAQFCYAILGLLTLGLAVLYLLFEIGLGSDLFWPAILDPYFAVGSVLWSEDAEWRHVWLLQSLIFLPSAGVLFWLAARRLGSVQAMAARVNTARAARVGGPEEPVAYREWLRGKGLRSWMWLALYPAVLLVPIVTTQLGRGHSDAQSGVILGLLGHTLYFTVRALASACTRVAAERDRRTWDLMLNTRLTAEELYRSNLRAVTRPLLIQLAACTPLLAVLLTTGELDLPGLLGVLLFTAVQIAAWAALGLWLSLRSRTALRAVQLATAALVAALVVPIWMDALLDELLRLPGDYFVFSFVNPVMGTLWFMPDLMRDVPALGPVCAGIYLGLAWVLGRASRAAFGRASRT